VANLAATLKTATHSLQACSDTPRLDAELLICHVLGIPKTYFFTHPEQEVTDQQYAKLDTLLQQRMAGQPIAYIIGYRYFWDLKLKVTPDTLIPRPETEFLVETALELGEEAKGIDVIDLGTGSGAIALSLAKARPNWHITATDQSSSALEVAVENADANGVNRITFVESHWFDRLDEHNQYDLIVSNPPYVPEQAPHLQERGVRYEPRQALVSGADGLDAIRILIPESKKHLKQNGWLLLEHGFDQGEEVKTLFEAQGYKNVQQKQDLGGHTRITYGQK